ncbi:MAG: arsenate reductase ArsC [Vulcanimicrobiota bacterium]
MKRVLFVSTGNSCRSPIAEGIANHHLKNKLEAFSAGVDASEIHPYAIKVLEEIGIDTSQMKVNNVDDFRDQEFDYIITLCDVARESCPVFWTQGEAVYEHFNYPDPSRYEGTDEQRIDHFRGLRDQIEMKLMEYFEQLPENKIPQQKSFIF